MTAADIAQQAMSLRDNEAFQLALSYMRNTALEHLAEVARTDVDKISDYQATVRVVDDLRANLDQFIRSGQPPKKAGIA